MANAQKAAEMLERMVDTAAAETEETLQMLCELLPEDTPERQELIERIWEMQLHSHASGYMWGRHEANKRR